jgi:hypothetical protein
MSYLKIEKYLRYLEEISRELDVRNISVPYPFKKCSEELIYIFIKYI